MKLKELTHEALQTAAADNKRKATSDLSGLSHLADGKDALIALEFLLEHVLGVFCLYGSKTRAS